MNKKDLIHILIRSEKSHKEEKYLQYITNELSNEIHNEINNIRKQLVTVSQYLQKEKLDRIRKRLHEIETKSGINRAEKKRLLNELTQISNDFKFERQNMISYHNEFNCLT